MSHVTGSFTHLGRCLRLILVWHNKSILIYYASFFPPRTSPVYSRPFGVACLRTGPCWKPFAHMIGLQPSTLFLHWGLSGTQEVSKVCPVCPPLKTVNVRCRLIRWHCCLECVTCVHHTCSQFADGDTKITLHSPAGHLTIPFIRFYSLDVTTPSIVYSPECWFGDLVMWTWYIFV